MTSDDCDAPGSEGLPEELGEVDFQDRGQLPDDLQFRLEAHLCVGAKSWLRHVPTQPTCGSAASISELTSLGVKMLDHISAGVDGGTVLDVAAVLVPALVLLWIILTVSALHRRDAYFWSLGSTWTSVIACPIALVIMSLGSWSQVNGPNAPHLHAVAGAILYLIAFGYAIFYNYKVTRSALLAASTSMLQQLAVLGAIFLFLRWRGEEVNRGR